MIRSLRSVIITIIPIILLITTMLSLLMMAKLALADNNNNNIFSPSPHILEEYQSPDVFPNEVFFKTTAYDSELRIAAYGGPHRTTVYPTVCRFSVEKDGFDPQHCISILSGVSSSHFVGIIHKGMGYFATDQQVCLVDMRTASSFAVVKCIETAGNPEFASAVLDAEGNVGYFAGERTVCAFSLLAFDSNNNDDEYQNQFQSLLSPCVSAPFNVRELETAVIDERKLYLGGLSYGAQPRHADVCQFELPPLSSSSNNNNNNNNGFSLLPIRCSGESVHNRSSSSSAKGFESAVVDAINHYGYFAESPLITHSGGTSYFATICKYRLGNGSTFHLVMCTARDSDSSEVSYLRPRAVAFDPTTGTAYFMTFYYLLRVNVTTLNSTSSIKDFAVSTSSLVTSPTDPGVTLWNLFLGDDNNDHGRTVSSSISSSSPSKTVYLSVWNNDRRSSCRLSANPPFASQEQDTFSCSFTDLAHTEKAAVFVDTVYDSQQMSAWASTQRGSICKFDLSLNSEITPVVCLQSPSTSNFGDGAVIDSQRNRAYFADSYNGKLCEYNLKDDSDETVVGGLSLVGCASLRDMVGLAIHHDNNISNTGSSRSPLIIAATSTHPGTVCTFRTIPSLALVSCATTDLTSPPSILFLLMSYNRKTSLVYPAMSQRPLICRFRLPPAPAESLVFEECAQIGSVGSNRRRSLIMDEDNNNLYVGLGDQEMLCVIDLDNFTSDFESPCVQPSPSSSQLDAFRNGAADAKNNRLYAVTQYRFCSFELLSSTTSLASLACFVIDAAGVTLNSFALVPMIFDSTRNTAWIFPGNQDPTVYRISVNSVNCSGNAVSYLIDEGTKLLQGPLSILTRFSSSSAFNFRNVRLPSGGVDFVQDITNSQLVFTNVSFSNPKTTSINFRKSILNVNITFENSLLQTGSELSSSSSPRSLLDSSANNESSTSSIITFSSSSALSSLVASSKIFFSNNSFSSSPSSSFSFITFEGTPTLDSTTNFIFRENTVPTTSLIARFTDDPTTTTTTSKSLPPFDLGSSKWLFACSNVWLNALENQFINQTANVRITRCLTQSSSLSGSLSQSIATNSQSASPNSSSSETASVSKSSSLSENISTSMSESFSVSPSQSESIFCFNLNEQQCTDVGPGNCHFCSTRNLCVPREQDCNCAPLDENLCPLATGCHYCGNANVCVEEDLDCECYVFEQTACKIATSTCRWCPNFNSCLPNQEKCYCSTLGETACTRLTQNKCTYCSQQEICLPKDEVDQSTCACPTLNSSNCQTSKCSWCDNYQTCSSLPSWDCDCTSLSNTSAASCSVDSNDHCKICQNERVCVDAKKFSCRCENFTQSVCGSSSCKWCDTLDSCTIPANKNCTCNWLRFEDSCNRNSNNKCSWCATSSDTGTAKHNSIIPNFNYCINKDGKDQCQCSYLSPSFCAAANDPSLNQNKNLSLSTSCRYCPNAGICAHPGNGQCECGNFQNHACGLASTCTWKDPVITANGGTEYCSAASVTCSPVTCEGILSKSSCDASGCSWNLQTGNCDSSSTCFNFFVDGFTPQPLLLWVIGLFKDCLVVFSIGAFANIFTRPIMKFVTSVKKKVLKQTHLKQQMMEKTVYMCDKHCRDDLPITFPQYVERVCDSIFELENEELVDEKNRRALFDAVAYTLFDNMIFVDVDLLGSDEDNFNKKFNFGGGENHTQQEMKDLTVDKVDLDEKEDNTDPNDEMVGETRQNGPRTKNSTTTIDKKEAAETVLETFTANVILRFKDYKPTAESEVNQRGQMFSRFAALIANETDKYLKNKNVDMLKVKVLLTAADFESAVTLTKKVDESLIERASAYVFYDQSRDRKVCAATSANTFPPALSLIYYSVALLFLFISSFITVYSFDNFSRIVQSCDEFIIPPTGNSNTSNANNITSTTPDSRSSNNENAIDPSFLTGAYFLLGFRLLNSSAFSTAILVFVKVVRGIYQRFSGIYTLSLQERIPLMALYSDRFIHVMLFCYALLVLPFALCGPTYGSSFGIYCWVPIFIAAAILIGDALVLYVSRRFSSLKNRLMTDEAANDEKQQALSKTFGDLNENFEDFLDSSPSKQRLQSEIVNVVPSAKPRTINDDDDDDNDDERNLEEGLLHTPRQGKGDETSVNQKKKEGYNNNNNNNNQKENVGEEPQGHHYAAELETEVLQKQSTIDSSSPISLQNALIVFILTEEIPVIVISLALQLSFNYAALLHYGDAFGVKDDHSRVYGRDYDSRSLSCIIAMFRSDVSSFVSGLSSFVPFM